MTRRRVIPAVLQGFLGTFISRYSDYDGYWLFGFLVDDLSTVTIDLLSEHARDSTPLDVTRRLAAQRFAEQVAKSGLPRRWIDLADLTVATSAQGMTGLVNGNAVPGHLMRFQARAVTDLGREYERTVSVFVAPHDPSIESRSLRAT